MGNGCIDSKKLEHNSRLGYITIVDMPGESRVKLYNYTRKTTFEGAWNEWTCPSRGLFIIDLEKKQIVACPFPKFFNYEELPKYNSGRTKTITIRSFSSRNYHHRKDGWFIGYFILFWFDMACMYQRIFHIVTSNLGNEVVDQTQYPKKMHSGHHISI